MTSIMSLRAEKPPYCKIVIKTAVCKVLSEMKYVCKGVAEMPSVCTGVAETPIDCSRLARTPPLTNKKWSGLMTTLVKKRHLRS